MGSVIRRDDAARLVIPFTAVPGLDPVGLPVVYQDERWRVTRIVVSREQPRACAIERMDGEGAWPAMPLDETLSFDLADDATADRFARWIANRVGLEVACTAPTWVFDGDWQAVSGNALAVFDDVPGLRDLDPSDMRVLASGARFVERVALGMVARHLGRSRYERPRRQVLWDLPREATHPG